MPRHLYILATAMSLAACGVEAGNPGGKPKTGTLAVSFAKEPNTEQESFSLQIGALDLLDSNAESIVASLVPSVTSVDLFGLTDEQETVIVEASEVPVGTYSQMLIHLDGNAPIRYRDRSGSERPIALESDAARSFYFDQSFEVVAGEKTTMVISLDPYRSVQDADDPSRGLVFKPHGDARRHDRDIGYASEVTIDGATWVCAYAYMLMPPPPPRGERPVGDHPLPPPPPRDRVESRISFASKEEITKDDSPVCANAFTKAPVSDGRFELRHLAPASYSLRVFTVDGSFDDSLPDIALDSHRLAGERGDARSTADAPTAGD